MARSRPLRPRLRASAPILAAALATAGCLCSEGPESLKVRESRPGASRWPEEIVAWDFAADAPAPLVALWPPAHLAPTRKKRQLLTSSRDGGLVAESTGTDAYFLWKLEDPLPATVLSLDVEARREGQLQLFWVTEDCEVFLEPCSAHAAIAEGEGAIDFVLGSRKALHALRLDAPAERGFRMTFRRIDVLGVPRLRRAWKAGNDETTVRLAKGRLDVESAAGDPAIVMATPGLDAESVRAIEVEMEGGEAPQLFWQGGPCGHFDERCAVFLGRVDGDPVWRAQLAGVAAWKGAVRALRLDPRRSAGLVGVRRIRLLSR